MPAKSKLTLILLVGAGLVACARDTVDENQFDLVAGSSAGQPGVYIIDHNKAEVRFCRTKAPPDFISDEQMNCLNEGKPGKQGKSNVDCGMDPAYAIECGPPLQLR
jgi:hypothetical protein